MFNASSEEKGRRLQGQEHNDQEAYDESPGATPTKGDLRE
jgi:hypothetical protein